MKLFCLRALALAIAITLATPGPGTAAPAGPGVQKFSPPEMNPRTVFLLQDAHESLGAQKEIAAKIHELQARFGIRTVAFEGAPYGPVIGDAFKTGAAPQALKSAADKFLADGSLGAVEYAYLTAPEEPRLWGVENPELYRKDLAHFRALLEKREGTLELWNHINRISRKPPLKLTRSHEKAGVDKLIRQLQDSHLDIIRWMRAIDPLVRSERLRTQPFQGYRELRDLAGWAGEKKEPPDFKQRVARLRSRNLLGELNEVAWSLREKMSDSREEKEWVRLRWRLALARKFLLGEITPEELSLLRSLGTCDSFEILAPALAEAEEFYRLAHERSKMMGENLLKYMDDDHEDKVILVAGGFHTKELTDTLRSQGMQVSVWSPRIPEEDRKIPYFDRMREDSPGDGVGRSQIRRWTVFVSETALARFREETGMTPERIGKMWEASWTRAASLGSQETVMLPASFEAVFAGLWTGSELLYQDSGGRGKPLFRVEVPGRLYVIDPALPKKTENVFDILFQDPEVSRVILAEYQEILRKFFLDTEDQRLHVDLLLFVLANYARSSQTQEARRSLELYEKSDFAPSILARSRMPDALEILKEWTARFRNDFLADMNLSYLLSLIALGQDLRLDGYEENPREGFLLSRSAGLFRSDSSGKIVNKDEVLIAFILHGVYQQQKTLEKFPHMVRYFHSKEAHDEFIRLLRDWPKVFRGALVSKEMIRAAWEMFFPVTRSQFNISATDRVKNWKVSYACEIVEDELGQTKDLKIQGASFAWARDILEPGPNHYDYHVVWPRSLVALNPFLTLRNPTDEMALFKVEGPGTRDETATLVRDEKTRGLVAGWLLFHFTHLILRSTAYVGTREGLPEVSQLDPIKVVERNQATVDAFFEELRQKGLWGMTLIPGQSNERGRVYNIPGTPDVEVPEFRETPARKLSVKDEKVRAIAADMAMALLQPARADRPETPFVRSEQELTEELRRSILKGLAPDFARKFSFEGIAPEVLAQIKTDEAIRPSTLTFRVNFSSGEYRVEFQPDILSFRVGKDEGRQVMNRYSRPEILGIRGVGRLILAAVFQYLLTQPLPVWEKKIFESWEPWLLRVYQDTLKKEGPKAEGHSLGVKETMEGPTYPKVSSPRVASSVRRPSHKGSTQAPGLRPDPYADAEGPYEVVVFWDALRRGVLTDQLAALHAQVPNLKVTIVDDVLEGPEIFRRLELIDPKGLLRPFLVQRQLVVPRHPRLEDHLKEARERLEKVYGSRYDSFLGVIFPDTTAQGEKLSAREILARAPHARRFVVQGKLSLGVVARAVFSLIGGNPREYFPDTFQDKNIWTSAPTPEDVLDSILAAHKSQIQLQLSV